VRQSQRGYRCETRAAEEMSQRREAAPFRVREPQPTAVTLSFEDAMLLERIFPAHFGERRIISEGYWNSCSIM
jgi:hypothetical protein